MRNAEKRVQHRSSGMSLIELMIAMVILVVGLIAIANVVVTAIASNNRNKLDTTGTMLAEMVMENITSVPANTNATFNLTDCSGAVHQINTTPAPGPIGAGAKIIQPGAANAGNIDYTQAQGGIPAGYTMDWITCGANNLQTTYEVRWNIVSGVNQYTKVVTVSSRKKMTAAAPSPNVTLFSPPVTLRGIAGT